MKVLIKMYAKIFLIFSELKCKDILFSLSEKNEGESLAC